MTATVHNPGMESDAQSAARHFRHERWEGLIYLTQLNIGGFVVGHAELFRAGNYMCRIVLGDPKWDEWAIANSLQSKAIDWIEDWERRKHGGTTGFADI